MKRKCFPIKNANTHVCNCTWSNFLFPFHVFSHFIVTRSTFFVHNFTARRRRVHISSHENYDVIIVTKRLKEKRGQKEFTLVAKKSLVVVTRSYDKSRKEKTLCFFSTCLKFINWLIFITRREFLRSWRQVGMECFLCMSENTKIPLYNRIILTRTFLSCT